MTDLPSEISVGPEPDAWMLSRVVRAVALAHDRQDIPLEDVTDILDMLGVTVTSSTIESARKGLHDSRMARLGIGGRKAVSAHRSFKLRDRQIYALDKPFPRRGPALADVVVAVEPAVELIEPEPEIVYVAPEVPFTCKAGLHLITGENRKTRKDRPTKGECRECVNERQRRYRREAAERRVAWSSSVSASSSAEEE